MVTAPSLEDTSRGGAGGCEGGGGGGGGGSSVSEVIATGGVGGGGGLGGGGGGNGGDGGGGGGGRGFSDSLQLRRHLLRIVVSSTRSCNRVATQLWPPPPTVQSIPMQGSGLLSQCVFQMQLPQFAPSHCAPFTHLKSSGGHGGGRGGDGGGGGGGVGGGGEGAGEEGDDEEGEEEIVVHAADVPEDPLIHRESPSHVSSMLVQDRTCRSSCLS